MEKQSIVLVNLDQESALSVDEFARLMARYRSVGYEAYYNWKLAQLYYQMPWSIESGDSCVGTLSDN
jgi:hypothetical protein